MEVKKSFRKTSEWQGAKKVAGKSCKVPTDHAKLNERGKTDSHWKMKKTNEAKGKQQGKS